MLNRQKILSSALAEVAQFSLFSGLPSSLLGELCQDSQVVFNSHRESVFRFGDEAHHFGIVMSGAYKLSRPTPQGDDTIVHFTTAGDVIGAFIMAQSTPKYPVSVIAMGPSRMLKIPRANYLQSWYRQPELILKIQNLLAFRMSQMQRQKALSKAPLSAKIAALLIELLNRQETTEDLVLPLPLTRKEIADSLGASVESVIRVMSDWSKQGILQTSEQQIRVLKPDKLVEEIKAD